MVEYPNSVVMAEKHREIVQSREYDFPYAALEADLKKYPGGCTPWHWHDHFEIAVVHRGSMEICTQQGSVVLKAGEGYFLNANVLHQSRAAKGCDEACMHAQLFTRDVISGTGLVGRRYITTIENCISLELLPLYPENEQHVPILRAINRAFSEAEDDRPGYEVFVSAHLCAAWGEIYRMAMPQIERSQGQQREDAVRAKAMLSYIYENYMRPISVQQIAAAAGICERECFRCFADVLGTTPMQYLTRHRLGIAARALAETGLSIAQIAENCGFTSSSYFGKVFHRELGTSPGEFRRKNS